MAQDIIDPRGLFAARVPTRAIRKSEWRHIECDDARWIPPAELRDYPFPPANEALIERVISLLSNAR